jgi:hypothetical protein
MFKLALTILHFVLYYSHHRTMSYKKVAQSVRITDRDAVRLINLRARAENRTSANAAATTIIESLGPAYAGDTTVARPGKQPGTLRIHREGAGP